MLTIPRLRRLRERFSHLTSFVCGVGIVFSNLSYLKLTTATTRVMNGIPLIITAAARWKLCRASSPRPGGPPVSPQAPLSPWSPKLCLAFNTLSLNKALL